MNETYTVSCETCESIPSIKFEISGVSAEKAKRMADVAQKAFRDVRIENDSTGEIMKSTYIDRDWFIQSLQYGEAIDMIGDIYAE